MPIELLSSVTVCVELSLRVEVYVISKLKKNSSDEP